MSHVAWRVACDDELSRSFAPHLRAAGFQVVSLHDAPLAQVDAVVLSRLDSNILGDTRRLSPALVVNAAGMTPQEVVTLLRERLGATGGNPATGRPPRATAGE